MMLRELCSVLVLGSLVCGTFGCVSNEVPEEYRGIRCEPESCTTRVRAPIDATGEHYHYVIDSVTFAQNPGEAVEHALDQDCSVPERADNLVGGLLTTIRNQLEVDINGITEELVSEGRVIHLVDVQALDLTTSSNIGVQMFVGLDSDADSSDNFSGSEVFSIDGSFASEPMAGHILDGALQADLGRVPLQVVIPGSEETFRMELSATMLEARVTPEQFTATLAGFLTEEQVTTGFLTATHTGIAGIIESECQDGCAAGSRGELLISYFDLDEDGLISLEEFVENELVGALTAPDVDVLDEFGNVNPDCDGINEGLSVAVLLTGVPAQIE